MDGLFYTNFMIPVDYSKLKSYIFTTYNQVEIFAEYLKIDESEIEYCLANTGNKINNPLRTDRHPSMGMKTVVDKETNELKIRMYDWADPKYRGDCFDLVRLAKQGLWYNSSGVNFIEICKDIIITMSKRDNISKPITKKLELIEHTFKNILYTPRNWNQLDIDFYKQQGLHYAEINKVIIPIQEAYVNMDYLLYKYDPKDPAYYYITGYYNKQILCKIYFPRRSKKDKRGRFFTNNSIFPLEGLHELRTADILVITKSYKDKLLLKQIFRELNFYEKLPYTVEVTNYTAETCILTVDLLRALYKTYKYVVINTDFDYAGIQALRIRKQYPVHYFYLTNGRFNTIDYGGKDPCEIVHNKGYLEMYELCRTTYNYFVNNIILQEDADNEIY